MIQVLFHCQDLIENFENIILEFYPFSELKEIKDRPYEWDNAFFLFQILLIIHNGANNVKTNVQKLITLNAISIFTLFLTFSKFTDQPTNHPTDEFLHLLHWQIAEHLLQNGVKKVKNIDDIGTLDTHDEVLPYIITKAQFQTVLKQHQAAFRIAVFVIELLISKKQELGTLFGLILKNIFVIVS